MLEHRAVASPTVTDLPFANPGVGLCLVAPDGTVLRANEEWLRSTGFAAGEAVGEDIVALFPETRDMALAMHDRARAGHRVEVPRHAQFVNGREIWWEGSIEPVPMAGGTGLLITARESSARRGVVPATHLERAEEALRDSEKRFRALVTATFDLVYRMSPDWKEIRELRRRGSTEDADVATTTWLGKHILPEDQPLLLASIGEAIRTKSLFELEHRLLREDGTVGWVFSRAVPIMDQAGAITEWFGAATDITERKRTESELLSSREQLRALAARLDSIREEEQRRISFELHDHAGQLLTVLKLRLERIEAKVDEHRACSRAAALLDEVVEATDVANETQAAVRQLARRLRAPMVDGSGLGDAIRREARHVQERTGLACAVRAPDDPPTLTPERATAAYRIVQEALTNVVRHAEARQALVSVDVAHGALVLLIEDDGRGLPDPPGPVGVGITGMRERAERLGGGLRLESWPGHGTRVLARIPLQGAC